MNSVLTFLPLFLLGFFSGGHCIGMCGGLSSAFVLQLPSGYRRLSMLLLLNAGRLSSYILIGAVLGSLGYLGISLDQTRAVQNLLFVAAHILLLFLGLYLAGLSQTVRKIESIGLPVWKLFSPVLNRLLPIRTLFSAFAAGFLWGWLPCGLVYSASLYALGSGNPLNGGLMMAAFGLGTLPNLLAVGIFAVQVRNFLQNRMVRLGCGLSVAAWAAWQLLRFGNFIA
ncbi:MAG: sulfite exporter TauE/SafE family protein [Neisseria sp.]|nr:sulfite exporter TauE/SafE family protein [Neisseria sp.]